MNSLCCSSHSALVTVKIKHWNIQSYNAKITVLCPLIAPPMVVFLSFDTCRSKSIKIKPQQEKSIKIDHHKKVCDWLLSISDICRLISIDNDRFLSTIGIIDMLRPGMLDEFAFMRRKNVLILIFYFHVLEIFSAKCCNFSQKHITLKRLTPVQCCRLFRTNQI